MLSMIARSHVSAEYLDLAQRSRDEAQRSGSLGRIGLVSQGNHCNHVGAWEGNALITSGNDKTLKYEPVGLRTMHGCHRLRR